MDQSIIWGCRSARILTGTGRLLSFCFLAFITLGCQTSSPTVSNRVLLAHLPGIDFSGLKPMESIDSVKVTCSLPSKWRPLRDNPTAMYTHQQWKSPSGYTGVGIVYAHLPFPLKAKTLLWFAKMEYSRNGGNGSALGEWTDELGRPWFEAENEKYHIRGYAITDGFSAWIVYSGYKLNRPMSASELNLAARCIDTIIPYSGEKKASHSALAEGDSDDGAVPEAPRRG